MAFQDIVQKEFGRLVTEAQFVANTAADLGRMGFRANNTIASVCVCRDELAQGIRPLVRNAWGEVFTLSSLGGLFFAGRTALRAGMRHSPTAGGRERHVYFALTHVAIDDDGEIGRCTRPGRAEPSVACGSLAAFLAELAPRKLRLDLDPGDVEQSMVRRRLLEELPYGHIPDLLELTRLALSATLADLTRALEQTADPRECDYAVLAGIQVHGPEETFVHPGASFALVRGERVAIRLDGTAG